MAQTEHVEKARSGTQDLKDWRSENPGEALDLDGAKLSNTDLANAPLRRSKLNEVELQGADLKKADLRGSELKNANLVGANLSEAKLMFADLTSAELSGSYLKNAYLNNANLSGAKLRGANLTEADFYCSNLSGTNLESAKMSGSYLTEANLEGCNLKNAQGELAQATHANLEGAMMVNAQFAKADFQNAKLSNTTINGGDLADTNLEGCAIQSASLKGTILNGSNLKKSDLSQTDLTDAELIHADLRGAKLCHAVFDNTDLSHARLHGIDFNLVDLSTARLIGTQIVNPRGGVFENCPIKTTFFGLYKCPEDLPFHPISDVVGLQPDVKRKIADAQYLREFARKNGFLDGDRGCTWRFSNWKSWAQERPEHMEGKPQGLEFWEWYADGGPLKALESTIKHALFRMWGIGSCFGQSMKRWIAWSAILALLFAGVYSGYFGTGGHEFAVQTGPTTTTSTVPDLATAFYFSLVTFTTLGFGDVTPLTGAGRFWVCLEVVFGYMMVGGLISIFSNKMTTLS